MTHIFALYDRTTDTILVRPLKNDKDESVVEAFHNVLIYLTKQLFNPNLNIMDNMASKAVQALLEEENTNLQLVEPHNHRINGMERVIQTFKNHMISGLSTTDVDFPLQLWDKITKQALITLNIVQTSRINPSKSAYHQLHGHRYNWNKYPMAPPGTRAVLLVDPTTRESWGTRGIDAWYVGPSFDHYRNCIFFVPETMAY